MRVIRMGAPPSRNIKIDKISWERSLTLHPVIRNEVQSLLQALIKEEIYIRLTRTLRSFEEQNQLYEKGRKTKGSIVTNARAGESWHNYGLAFDICALLPDLKSVLWDWEYKNPHNLTPYPDLTYATHLFKQSNYEWGGDWKTFIDKPHFQYPHGLTLEQARQRLEDGNVDKEGYIYLNKELGCLES